MTYYKDNTLFKRKDDRLHIYKRKDKKVKIGMRELLLIKNKFK